MWDCKLISPKRLKRAGFWSVMLTLLTLTSCSNDTKKASTASLQKRLEAFISSQQGQIGVAIIIDGRDTVCVNNENRYPLMSVFKLHQAVAVTEYCQRIGQSLCDSIYIDKADLYPDTYSPLRDAYPEGGIHMPLSELLRYTLCLSDNNACDILFKHTVSPTETDRYLRNAFGLDSFAIAATEDDMHRDAECVYQNWSTPLETARLLEEVYNEAVGRVAFGGFIKNTLLTCQTGQNRLAAGLTETTARLGHKTGTSDRNDAGRLVAINDAGFVDLTDGRHYTIAAFVSDYAGSAEDAEAIIAELSRIAYRHICDMP